MNQKLFLLLLVTCSPVAAQTDLIPTPSKAPLEVNLLRPNANLAGLNVITATTISQRNLTVPSLWWTREQFAGKFVTNWIAYPNERRIDVVVNRQLWSIQDYVGRYEFVNKFGTDARDFGYNLRVFNEQAEPVATYTCSFNTPQPTCRLVMESSGQDGLQLRPNRSF